MSITNWFLNGVIVSRIDNVVYVTKWLIKREISDETFNFSFESIPRLYYTFDTEIQMKQTMVLYKMATYTCKLHFSNDSNYKLQWAAQESF